MRFFNQIFIKFLLLSIFVALNNCGEPSSNEMTKGHRQAIKEQCKNDPDKKLCGKEVRINFKKDGHKYVNFKELSKAETNRVAINCKPEKKYGLVAYNDCLYNNKQLALGNDLTPKDDKRITSNIDAIKQYVYYIETFNEGDEQEGKKFIGTGVAIAKNLIATNCHVITDKELSLKNKKAEYLDIIFVENVHDEKKRGTVKLFKRGYEKNLDICILKTKSDIKYVKTKVKYKKLKQRMKVMAVGNPLGIIGHVSDGKITALEKRKWFVPMHSEKYITLKNPHKIIHHDSSIGSGSSGGPLFDAGGNLIGINTWILSEDGTSGGFGLALSADHINDVLRD